MRIFAVLLLLANLAYLAWHLADGRASPSAAVVRSPAREAPQRLVLLSESEAAPPPAVPAAAPVAPTPMAAERCLEVGVLADADEGGRFVGEAGGLGVDVELKSVEVREPPDYWVHMPPFVSEAAAQRRLEELKASGIDSYLIIGGALDRGISLGFFSIQESALRHQRELEAKGYGSEIREVARSYTELWADVAGLRQDAAAEAQWAQFMSGWQGLRQVEKLCETIAQ